MVYSRIRPAIVQTYLHPAQGYRWGLACAAHCYRAHRFLFSAITGTALTPEALTWPSKQHTGIAHAPSARLTSKQSVYFSSPGITALPLSSNPTFL